MNKNLKIFLIAGEASGDYLGARLIQALKKLYKGNLVLKGAGGKLMAKEGVKATYSLSAISVLGVFEVLSIIFKVKRLLSNVEADIKQFKPNILITIDSPGFCLRLAKRVKYIKQLYKTKFVHYVSPTVWAYKSRRISYMEKFYDLLLVIFPFEPAYYKNSKLPCKYVGHPVLEYNWDRGNAKKFRTKYKIPLNQDVLGAMVGSRVGEVKRMLPIFVEAINLAIKKYKIAPLVIFPVVSNEIKTIILSWKDRMMFNYKVVSPRDIKTKVNMFKAFDHALVKSGTSSHELTAAYVPMIVGYKLHPITYYIGKYLFKIPSRIKFVSITNLLLKREVIPEYIQNNCTVENLCEGLMKLYDTNFCQRQRVQYKLALQKLSVGSFSPSELATKHIIQCSLNPSARIPRQSKNYFF